MAQQPLPFPQIIDRATKNLNKKRLWSVRLQLKDFIYRAETAAGPGGDLGSSLPWAQTGPAQEKVGWEQGAEPFSKGSSPITLYFIS